MSTATQPDLKGKLEQVNEQIAAKRQEAQTTWKSFEQAREQFAQAGEDVNDTGSEAFKAAEEAHKPYAATCEKVADLERVRDGIFSMLGRDAPKADEQIVTPQAPVGESKSIGERAVDSDGYAHLKESGVLNSDRASFNAQLTKSSVAELKALITGLSDTSGGALITNDRLGAVAAPRRQTRVLDLITMGQTGTDTVEYARQTAFTNVAAETAESTVVTDGAKPEASIAFEKVTAPVRTIAHWIPATRRALADVPQLRTLIDSQLRYGLEFRLESQVVAGDGAGENLTGILNTANILTQAKGTDSEVDAIHKAITQIRLGFLEPNGVALHPNDWQAIRLAKNSGGDYYYGPPALAGTEQVWGVAVAVSPAVTENTGIVGDFRQATLWLREGVQVLASDSHSDFFVRNLVAILAEMRAAFGVLLPASFAKVTGI